MFASVALVAISLLASSVVAQSCGRNYTVVAGDTCDGISAAHSVSTYQLATLNSAIDDACSNLEVGESLCLGLTDGSDCTTTATVSSGDTCDGITAQFGINSTYLYMNNPQIDAACDNIYLGEVLCVGSKVYVGGGAAASAPSVVSSASSAVVTSAAASTAPLAAAAPDPTTLILSTSVTPTPTSTSATPTATADGDDDDLPDCEDDDDDGSS